MSEFHIDALSVHLDALMLARAHSWGDNNDTGDLDKGFSSWLVTGVDPTWFLELTQILGDVASVASINTDFWCPIDLLGCLRSGMKLTQLCKCDRLF